MKYHPPECKESKYVESSFPTSKQMKNIPTARSRNPVITGSKKMTPNDNTQYKTKDQIDVAQPKKKDQPKPSRRSTKRNSSTATSATTKSYKHLRNQTNLKRDHGAFEKYLIKENEKTALPSKGRKLDLHSSTMHKIVTSKEGLRELVQKNDETEKVMEKISEVPHLNVVPSADNNNFQTQQSGITQQHHQDGYVYEQNPMTGKFFRRRTFHLNHLHQGAKVNRDAKVEKYNFFISVLCRIADVVHMFVSGILAGFSIYTLQNNNISSLPSSDVSMSFQNNGCGIIRFYLMSITLCSTGVIVKGNIAFSRNEMRILALPYLLIGCHTLALVFTLILAKVELNLQHESETDLNSVLNQVSTWRNLSIIRSVISITQWLIVCYWNTASKTYT